MKRVVVLASAVALAACNGDSGAQSLVAATIIRRADTVRFDVPLTVYRCDSSSDYLLQAFQSGNGVLLWLRLEDSLTGELPVLGVSDTITRPGAIVAVRYYEASVVHAFTLDSGTVSVADSGRHRRLAVSGSGMETQFGTRSGVVATIAALPAPADSTTSCTSAR